MSSRNQSRTTTENVLQKHYNLPIQMTNLSTFDDNYYTMKERFAAEMQRVEEEMNRFSTSLTEFYAQIASTGISLSQHERPTSPSGSLDWDALINSPLVLDDGEAKVLKLQFDVSQFSPNEVNVKILDNMLVVTGLHEERSDNTSVRREYHREFLLPKGIDREAIVSSLSRDGVLTIQAPMPLLAVTEKKAEEK